LVFGIGALFWHPGFVDMGWMCGGCAVDGVYVVFEGSVAVVSKVETRNMQHIVFTTLEQTERALDWIGWLFTINKLGNATDRAITTS
jgi:hypothetical protein